MRCKFIWIFVMLLLGIASSTAQINREFLGCELGYSKNKVKRILTSKKYKVSVNGQYDMMENNLGLDGATLCISYKGTFAGVRYSMVYFGFSRESGKLILVHFCNPKHSNVSQLSKNLSKALEAKYGHLEGAWKNSTWNFDRTYRYSVSDRNTMVELDTYDGSLYFYDLKPANEIKIDDNDL